MPEVTGATLDEAQAALSAETERMCLIAFAFDCRLALCVTGASNVGGVHAFSFEFIVLSPGERPPQGRGWTVYENRGGVAVGRSA